MKTKLSITLIFIFLLAAILPLGAVTTADWGYQPEMLGDANLDNDVNAADAALILRYLVRLEVITDGYQLACMDTDENGDITSADAAHILRYIVRLGTLPPNGSCVPIPTAQPTALPSTSPRVTPTPTPKPTPSPVPTPTPELETSAGLILHANDPYHDKILRFYNNNNYTFTSAGTTHTLKTNSTHCKNIIGWIYMQFYGERLDGTRNTVTIDYPIMYGTNLYGSDYYYGTHNENGESRDSGSIYAIKNSLQVNNVISGHNSRTYKWRFYDLHTLQNKIKSEAVNGRASGQYDFTISLFGYYDWRVWAMYETTSIEPDSTQLYNLSYNCENNVTKWVNYQKGRSEVNFGVTVTSTDKFITLETCGDAYDHDPTAQSRLYIFLVRVD